MNRETKQCQNCKSEFTIEPEDFLFYEKIQVPPPTWCPDCRAARRMVWRNERSLYKKQCAAPNHHEELVTMYAPSGKDLTIYDQKFWWSDGFDPLMYGKNVSFEKPLLTQFASLLSAVPLAALSNVNQTNSEYCNIALDSKDCYLCFGATSNEGMLYCNRVANCRDSADLYLGHKAELCYESNFIEESTSVYFSDNCRGCLDSRFLEDCYNCSHCFGCVGLRGREYYFFNKPFTKERYAEEIKGLDLGSAKNIERIKKEFAEFKSKYIHEYAHFRNIVQSTGDHISNAKNAKDCFDIVNGMENCRFCVWGGYRWNDSYDGIGAGNGEMMYETVDTGAVAQTCSNTLFSVSIHDSMDVSYSYFCRSSSNLFACVGLRNKHYCILNKQYTKEEYESLIPRIREHMNVMPYIDQKGRTYKYGEFFSSELSPFAYNETIAQEYFPLTKEDAQRRGYIWKDVETKGYTITKESDTLPDHINDVDDSILKETIGCAHKGTCSHQCTTAFRIIPEELKFYRRMSLPLPRLCPNCRHYERLARRNPLKLWHRTCQCGGAISENGVYTNTAPHQHGTKKCMNEFETSYSPDRPEIIYCEQCYQAEVV